MTGTIRVLIADDSSAVRGVLSKVIAAEPKLELIGAASNGAIAVEKAARLRPDVIVLDIEMPVMTGLEAVVEIRKRDTKTPIIMFSTLTEHGADITLEALSKGASDYAAKPTNTGTAVSSIDQIRQELVTKIIGFGSHAAPAAARTQVSLAVNRQSKVSSVKALLIGSSTGGPAALEKVLTGLTRPLPIPIIIVQHMPATFTGVLASRLNSCCSFPVHEVAQGMKIEAGSCYVAAGGQHLKLAATGLSVTAELDDGPKVKSCRPSVDVMFDSATKAYGGSVLATVLTGMGDDGLDAAGRLVAKGIEVIVQDEATSVVWGMPGAIAKAGLASLCLPLDQIASAIVKKTSLSGLGSVARPAPAGTAPRSAARTTALTSPERRP